MNYENLLMSSHIDEDDLKLLSSLGIKPFTPVDEKEQFVGEYGFPYPTYEKAKVKIFVSCLPAQFWRFEITTEEGLIFNINTGSGFLYEFWPSIVLIADGRLNIDYIKKIKK